ncbi:hypothetical protein P280DRAFT_502937 [Massarina eburnea CBS 473.64]|uniref:Uncharacterized protein n=1 Tax=Massarina eburnea CBS 473.64 TaxID=1395130 RepID=A0A6A6SH95_9PLEO|nr:hypothetical protein P280DRAFT_502937 [Massarina eburnea CBS 473.64]
MDSLTTTFTIEVGGSPIAPAVADSDSDRSQAKTGSEAAEFTLKDGRLQSGGYFLGRSTIEDRSFLPKPVLWFKAGGDGSDKAVKPVTAHQEGDKYLIKFQNASLIVNEGNVLADLGGETHDNVSIKLKS